MSPPNLGAVRLLLAHGAPTSHPHVLFTEDVLAEDRTVPPELSAVAWALRGGRGDRAGRCRWEKAEDELAAISTESGNKLAASCPAPPDIKQALVAWQRAWPGRVLAVQTLLECGVRPPLGCLQLAMTNVGEEFMPSHPVRGDAAATVLLLLLQLNCTDGNTLQAPAPVTAESRQGALRGLDIELDAPLPVSSKIAGAVPPGLLRLLWRERGSVVRDRHGLEMHARVLPVPRRQLSSILRVVEKNQLEEHMAPKGEEGVGIPFDRATFGEPHAPTADLADVLAHDRALEYVRGDNTWENFAFSEADNVEEEEMSERHWGEMMRYKFSQFRAAAEAHQTFAPAQRSLAALAIDFVHRREAWCDPAEMLSMAEAALRRALKVTTQEVFGTDEAPGGGGDGVSDDDVGDDMRYSAVCGHVLTLTALAELLHGKAVKEQHEAAGDTGKFTVQPALSFAREATALVRAALQLLPDHADALATLYDLLVWDTGSSYDISHVPMLRLLEIDPRNSNVMWCLAEDFAEMQEHVGGGRWLHTRRADAERLFCQALAITPAHEGALNGLGTLLASTLDSTCPHGSVYAPYGPGRRMQEGMALFEAAAEQDDSSSICRVLFANALWEGARALEDSALHARAAIMCTSVLELPALPRGPQDPVRVRARTNFAMRSFMHLISEGNSGLTDGGLASVLSVLHNFRRALEEAAGSVCALVGISAVLVYTRVHHPSWFMGRAAQFDGFGRPNELLERALTLAPRGDHTRRDVLAVLAFLLAQTSWQPSWRVMNGAISDDLKRSEELRAEMRAINPTIGNDRRYTSGGFYMRLFWPEDAARETASASVR